MRHLNNAGDTIVEVLICIAVVSMVLGGAFVTTRSSQAGVRNAQEHAEVVKLLESQLEQIRGDVGNTTGVPVAKSFCMYNGAVTYPPSGDCTQNSAGQSKQPDSRYAITVTRCTTGPCNSISGSSLFTASVTWDSVTGQGTEFESMYYRLY